MTGDIDTDIASLEESGSVGLASINAYVLV
jgi:hypothetical protein